MTDGSDVVDTAKIANLNREIHFKLSGPQNNTTITRDAKGMVTGGHQASEIFLLTRVGAPALTAVELDDFTNVTEVTLTSGVTARVVSQKNGLSGVSVEWVADGNSYQLMTSRWKTPDGISGVSQDDLVKMAGSLA